MSSQMQKGNFLLDVQKEDNKNARPRIIKEYRRIKEYYPWRTLTIPTIFPIIGLIPFYKSVTSFMKPFWFGGIFFLLLTFAFWGIGIMFASSSKSGFDSCKRLREEIKEAQYKGAYYKGEILGYRYNVNELYMHRKGCTVREITLTYVLEVEFLEGTRYKKIETPELKYHPNAVLQGNRCRVYSYEGKYYVGNFELRGKKSDPVAEIPLKGMVGEEK